MNKDEYLQIRVSKTEKDKIKKEAKQQGFDSISAFLLWLFRKSIRKS